VARNHATVAAAEREVFLNQGFDRYASASGILSGAFAGNP
jgi:hypothetical protein